MKLPVVDTKKAGNAWCAGARGKQAAWAQALGGRAASATAAALAEVTPATAAQKTQERKPAWWSGFPWSQRRERPNPSGTLTFMV